MSVIEDSEGCGVNLCVRKACDHSRSELGLAEAAFGNELVVWKEAACQSHSHRSMMHAHCAFKFLQLSIFPIMKGLRLSGKLLFLEGAMSAVDSADFALRSSSTDSAVSWKAMKYRAI